MYRVRVVTRKDRSVWSGLTFERVKDVKRKVLGIVVHQLRAEHVMKVALETEDRCSRGQNESTCRNEWLEHRWLAVSWHKDDRVVGSHQGKARGIGQGIVLVGVRECIARSR